VSSSPQLDNRDGSVASAQEPTRILVWDGWRGMAILLVLCGHFYDIKWVWEDRMGVDVFFVLSGMLMSIILFEKRITLRDFYIRRLSRIYPAFFVCVVTMFALAFVLRADFSWKEILASLTFMRTYLPPEPGIWGSEVSVAHFWSLNVEEHAYLFLSAITLLLINIRFIAVGLLIVAAGSVVLSFYHYLRMPADQFLLYMIRTESAVVFILFSAGYGLLARKHKITLPAWVPALCLCLAFVCYAQVLPYWLIFSVCPVLLGIAVNHIHDMPRFIKYVFSNPVVRQFGLWSYSIYLWQQVFYENNWRLPGGFTTALVLAVICGILSYYFLEKPARLWINNRWSKKPVYRVQEA